MAPELQLRPVSEMAVFDDDGPTRSLRTAARLFGDAPSRVSRPGSPPSYVRPPPSRRPQSQRPDAWSSASEVSPFSTPSYIGKPDPRESETSFLAAPPARPDLARPRPSRLPPPPPPSARREPRQREPAHYEPAHHAAHGGPVYDEATIDSDREDEPSPMEMLFPKGIASLDETPSEGAHVPAYIAEPAQMPAPSALEGNHGYAPAPSYPPTYVPAAPNDSWAEAPWLVPSPPPTARRASMLPLAATASAILALVLVGAVLFAVRATDAGARRADSTPPGFAQPVLATASPQPGTPQPLAPQPLATQPLATQPLAAQAGAPQPAANPQPGAPQLGGSPMGAPQPAGPQPGVPPGGFPQGGFRQASVPQVGGGPPPATPAMAPALMPPMSGLPAQGVPSAVPTAPTSAVGAATKRTPRPSAARTPKPAAEPREPAKPKTTGKSVEDILNELGEEQLKR